MFYNLPYLNLIIKSSLKYELFKLVFDMITILDMVFSINSLSILNNNIKLIIYFR